MRDPETLDPDWARFPTTVLHFAADARIDLRCPVGRSEMDVLSALGLIGPFAVITAHDPRGLDLSAAENEERTERFEEHLRSNGIGFRRVDACSPDGRHCEASAAAIVPYDDACQLAVDHGQVAFFWFDGERFWIAGGLLDTDPVALPRAPLPRAP